MENLNTENKEILEEKKDFRPIWIYIVFSFVLPVIIAVIGGIITGGIDEIETVEKLNYITSIILNFIMFFAFLFMYFKKIKIDIKRLTKKNIMFTIVIAIFAFMVNAIVDEIFTNFNITSTNQDLVINILNIYTVPMIINVVLVAPIIEEILFRYSLSTIIKNNVLFVIISAVLFGISHGLGITTLLYAFMGMIFAIIYIKTNKNLIAATSAHMINNFLGILVAMVISTFL